MRQWTIDAFAAEPFKGNPACVVEPFAAWPDDGWMQALAAENNQAETAFLRRTGDPALFDLRWFTPALEVPLCGHATLACAHVLLNELGVAAETLNFETRWSGVLGVSRHDDRLMMDFPMDRPERLSALHGLAEALGVRPAEVWAGRYVVAVLDSEAEVRGLKPDLGAVAKISEAERKGNVAVVATADVGRDYDVVSRFFAPGSGIPEDPATGSLHCILAPLYANKLGRARNHFHQAYPGRGGDLDCEVRGERVMIGGQAVTVLESQILV